MTTVEATGAIAAPTGPDAPPAAPAPGARPEYVPEKFWDAEKGEVNVQALATSYAELEKGKSAAPAPGGDEITVEPDADATAAAEALAQVGLDFSEFTAEYEKDGSLSEDTYTKLAGRGFDKDLVDTYIAGHQAKLTGAQDAAAKVVNTAVEAVGGQEAYGELVTWAGSNLKADEVAYYNTQVNSGDATQVNAAVEWLQAKHVAAEGGSPRLVGGANPGNGSDVFTSWPDVQSAMSAKDPNTGKALYETSPEYRSKIEAKLARSNI